MTVRRPTRVKLVLGADTVLMGCAELARAVKPPIPAGPIALPPSWNATAERPDGNEPTAADAPVRNRRPKDTAARRGGR